jgi:hypothetical protein
LLCHACIAVMRPSGHRRCPLLRRFRVNSGHKNISKRAISYVRVMAHNTIPIKAIPTPRATMCSRQPLGRMGLAHIVDAPARLKSTRGRTKCPVGSHSNRVSGVRGLRFRETIFWGPETQLPIKAPDSCCAISETEREHRIPPIRGYSRASGKSPHFADCVVAEAVGI